MRVRVIGVTHPTFAPDDIGEEASPTTTYTVPDSPEALIAYCARVSNPANQMNTETAPRLLKYLTSRAHWSPFEMAHAVLEIQTTRDIAHQILRHWSFRFQEFSQRYAAVLAPPVFRTARLQDTANRQNSLATDDQATIAWWDDAQHQVAELTTRLYQEALSRQIAKEVARAILPEGMTPTTLYMSGVMRSWIHYIQLRTAPGTQLEHREVALACREALLTVFPTLQEVFDATHTH